MKQKGLQTKHALKPMRYEGNKEKILLTIKNIIKDSKTNQAFMEYNKMQRRIQEMIGRKMNLSKLS
jgi:hypothetical protein